MTNYDEINYVLANYFSAVVDQSEDEAVQALEDELRRKRDFAERLSRELDLAREDEGFSWREALTEFEVATFEDEPRARSFVDRVLSSLVRRVLGNV